MASIQVYETSKGRDTSLEFGPCLRSKLVLLRQRPNYSHLIKMSTKFINFHFSSLEAGSEYLFEYGRLIFPSRIVREDYECKGSTISYARGDDGCLVANSALASKNISSVSSELFIYFLLIRFLLSSFC